MFEKIPGCCSYDAGAVLFPQEECASSLLSFLPGHICPLLTSVGTVTLQVREDDQRHVLGRDRAQHPHRFH